MIKSLSEKTKKKTPELNTLNVLLQSLENQFQKLDSVNKNIDNLKSELKGGSFQGKREKVERFIPGQEKKTTLKE